MEPVNKTVCEADVEMKATTDKAEVNAVQPKSIDELIELAQNGAAPKPVGQAQKCAINL